MCQVLNGTHQIIHVSIYNCTTLETPDTHTLLRVVCERVTQYTVLHCTATISSSFSFPFLFLLRAFQQKKKKKFESQFSLNANPNSSNPICTSQHCNLFFPFSSII